MPSSASSTREVSSAGRFEMMTSGVSSPVFAPARYASTSSCTTRTPSLLAKRSRRRAQSAGSSSTSVSDAPSGTSAATVPTPAPSSATRSPSRMPAASTRRAIFSGSQRKCWSRPCVGSWRAMSRRIQRTVSSLRRPSSSSVRGLPWGMWCHLAMQPRQQVAVACCAVKTGCPRKGVCLPSRAGCAGPTRLSRSSRACLRMVASPCSSA